MGMQLNSLPSSELKDQVLHQVTEAYPNTLTFQVSVQNPVYRTVDVQAKISFSETTSSSRSSTTSACPRAFPP